MKSYIGTTFIPKGDEKKNSGKNSILQEFRPVTKGGGVRGRSNLAPLKFSELLFILL